MTVFLELTLVVRNEIRGAIESLPEVYGQDAGRPGCAADHFGADYHLHTIFAPAGRSLRGQGFQETLDAESRKPASS